jgi:hypothetical protein
MNANSLTFISPGFPVDFFVSLLAEGGVLSKL